MLQSITMSAQYEAEKNRKAFLYSALIMGGLLLIALFIKWKIFAEVKPVAQDFIEINLGNFEEGYGETQPLIKGEKAPSDMPSQPEPVKASAPPTQQDEKDPENDDPEAAPVTKTVKETPKVTKPAPVVAPPAPKPQKPKIAGYDGPKTGTGNGATQDNGYKYQGNNPNGRGDAGNPNGKPDSYGNNPGGRTGGSGLRVSKGDRKIINNYIFMGDLPKATINAVIKVSPEGRGTFVGFDKGSTSSDSRYANAIRSYMPNIQFNKSDHESVVTVPFNFTVQQ
jgi:hypothetical protein